MWLFHLHSAVENTTFFPVFPLAESRAKVFCRLFLWNFKEKGINHFLGHSLLKKGGFPQKEAALFHKREPAMAGLVQRLFSNGRSLGILLSLFVTGQAPLLEPCVLLTLFHVAAVTGVIAVLGVERLEEAWGNAVVATGH